MRSVEAVRDRLLERVATAVRTPGTFAVLDGLDLFFGQLLGDLAFIDDAEDDLAQAIAEVIDGRGLRSPIGTRGPLAELLPDRLVREAIAAVWAEVAWRSGWLPINAVAPIGEFERVAAALEGAVAADVRGEEARRILGTPSCAGRGWLALVAEDGRWLVVLLDTRRASGGYVSDAEAAVSHVVVPASSFVAGVRATPHGRTAA